MSNKTHHCSIQYTLAFCCFSFILFWYDQQINRANDSTECCLTDCPELAQQRLQRYNVASAILSSRGAENGSHPAMLQLVADRLSLASGLTRLVIPPVAKTRLVLYVVLSNFTPSKPPSLLSLLVTQGQVPRPLTARHSLGLGRSCG